MPHKEKIPTEEKVRIVEGYLAGKIGYSEAIRIAGIADVTWRRWVSRYKAEGPEGFQPIEENRVYSAKLKVQAVKDYLDGRGSLKDICEKYRIRSQEQLRNWIKVYNRHEEFRIYTGGSYMTKGRKTSKEERLAIAEECIANGNNYGQTALKYNVSYQQVYIWAKKVQKQGKVGLDDRRGRHVADWKPQTEEERLRKDNEQLKKANYRLQMENDFLKKLKEVERRNR
jgi:transposase-like protein